MSGAGWSLTAASGRESATWTVVDRPTADVLACDVTLAGSYFGETLDGGARDAVGDDYTLTLRGLRLRRDELGGVVDRLSAGLSLPPARLLDESFGVSCGMGGLFDQTLLLELGSREDVSAAGRLVATLRYIVGRMRGELVFLVDPSCLEAFVDGLRRTLEDR